MGVSAYVGQSIIQSISPTRVRNWGNQNIAGFQYVKMISITSRSLGVWLFK